MSASFARARKACAGEVGAVLCEHAMRSLSAACEVAT
jgi:hypothetical protein